jgi:hypothetical protein
MIKRILAPILFLLGTATVALAVQQPASTLSMPVLASEKEKSTTQISVAISLAEPKDNIAWPTLNLTLKNNTKQTAGWADTGSSDMYHFDIDYKADDDPASAASVWVPLKPVFAKHSDNGVTNVVGGSVKFEDLSPNSQLSKVVQPTDYDMTKPGLYRIASSMRLPGLSTKSDNKNSEPQSNTIIIIRTVHGFESVVVPSKVR